MAQRKSQSSPLVTETAEKQSGQRKKPEITAQQTPSAGVQTSLGRRRHTRRNERAEKVWEQTRTIRTVWRVCGRKSVVRDWESSKNTLHCLGQIVEIQKRWELFIVMMEIPNYSDKTRNIILHFTFRNIYAQKWVVAFRCHVTMLYDFIQVDQRSPFIFYSER